MPASNPVGSFQNSAYLDLGHAALLHAEFGVEGTVVCSSYAGATERTC